MVLINLNVIFPEKISGNFSLKIYIKIGEL